MQVLQSIIDPATALADKPYVIAFRDDDWDHWASLDQANTYRGWRANGRWGFAWSSDGETGDWTYDDDEIVVLAEWEQAS